MKRRDTFGFAILGAITSLFAGKAAATPKDKNTRRVFKVVEQGAAVKEVVVDSVLNDDALDFKFDGQSVAISGYRRRSGPVTHIRVGGEHWEPTPEQIEAIVEAYRTSEADPNACVIGTHYDVEITPSFLMMESRFNELKAGDMFVMYEDTGELVLNDEGAWLWKVSGPAYQSNGVWTVESDEVLDLRFTVPDHL